MRALVIALILSAAPATADTWIKLDGATIEDTLNDTTWDYKAAWQTFHASGRTLYNAGRDSWGSWRVQGDQYCSEWPPNAGWDCYDLYFDMDLGRIKFVGRTGEETIGWPRT